MTISQRISLIKKQAKSKWIFFLPFILLSTFAIPALAFDQPWNGNREDITGPPPPPPPPCSGNECDCPPNGTGSPVYLADGSLVWSDVDITFPASTRVGIKRTYNSIDYRAGLFGRGWVTAQEINIARTYRAVTEGNEDGSPRTATEFESVPIWLASYGRRYFLEETETECRTPQVLYFTFEKTPDGGFRQVFEDSDSFNVYSQTGVLLQSYSDKDGTTIYYEYDDQDRLIQQSDSYGFTLNFSYNDQGFVSQVTDQASRVWNYSYDEFGRLVQVLNPDGNTKDYGYRRIDSIGYSQHLLTSVDDDGDDPVLRVTWDNLAFASGEGALMRVTSYTESDGHRHDYTYTRTTYQGVSAVRVIKNTNQVGINSIIESHTYYVDSANYRILNRTNTTDNISLSRSYNERGRVSEEIDERGNTTRYEYNDAGRRTRVVELADTDSEKVMTYTYWNNTDRVAVFNEYGLRETRYTYDDDLRRLTQTQVDLSNNQQRITTYTYYPNFTDSQGNVVLGKMASMDGPQVGTQDTTRYQYNEQGFLTRIDYPLNQSVSYIYNTLGQQISHIDRNSITAQMVYDSQNRMIQSTRNGRTILFAYNGQGQLTRITDELGRATSLSYTDQNQLNEVTYPSGDILRATYNYNAAYTEVTLQLFDTDNNLLSSQITRNDPDNNLPINQYLGSVSDSVNQNTYNSLDELTTQTLFGEFEGANSATYTYSYDQEGRLSQIQDALNGIATIAYDEFDRQTQVQDPNNATTQYQYTAWGELLQLNSPDTGTSTYQVDSSGNTIEQVNANNQQVLYTYDALNRVTAIDYEGDSEDVSLTYDTGEFGTGLLSGATDGSGSSQYQYDDRGLITQMDNAIAGVSFSTGYTYSDAEERTQITYPSGNRVTFTYGNDARLSAVELNRESDTLPIISNIIWRGNDFSSHQHGNGITTNFAYDAAGRLIEKVYGSADNRMQNQLDNQGNITQQAWVRDGAEEANPYAYDPLGRLVSDGGDPSGLDWLFNYDAVGNRLAKASTDNTNTTNYVYQENANRLTEIDSVEIELDAAGNTTNDGSRQYQYNVFNRLASVSNSESSAEAAYIYNFQGQRVRKVLSGSLAGDIRYVYGLAGELLGEYDAAGEFIREYIYSYQNQVPELLAQVESDGSTLYVHTDHLATPRLATNGEQTIVWRWLGEAFGDSVPMVDPDGDGNETVLIHRFPGQYFDSETNLNYNYYRTYDSSAGRYIQSDPLGLYDGPNTYLYAQANPLFYTDPQGLAVCGGACIGPAIVIGGRILLNQAAKRAAKKAAQRAAGAAAAAGGNDPNGDKCQRLAEKIQRTRDEIYNKRFPDLMNNPGNLPQRIGPGERLRDTVRGHEKLLNRRLNELKKLEDQYDQQCRQECP